MQIKFRINNEVFNKNLKFLLNLENIFVLKLFELNVCLLFLDFYKKFTLNSKLIFIECTHYELSNSVK
jgi:hypothetical protein